MQAGGYTHSWKSAYVLAQLILGFMLMGAFCFWEYKFAKLPLVPHEMFRGQRIVGMAYFIAFVAGKHIITLVYFRLICFLRHELLCTPQLLPSYV